MRQYGTAYISRVALRKRLRVDAQQHAFEYLREAHRKEYRYFMHRFMQAGETEVMKWIPTGNGRVE
jgi:hypothetical protein